jgi:hypothetical protein
MEMFSYPGLSSLKLTDTTLGINNKELVFEPKELPLPPFCAYSQQSPTQVVWPPDNP